MLNISNHDNFNNIKEQADILKVGMSLYKNSQIDAATLQLIDETDISNTALNLYEKEQDIKKFTQLALSDPENSSHNQLALDTLISTALKMRENELTNALMKNDKFMKDLLG